MPFRELEPNLFQWTDTCNVYVLREGDAAILIDLGDGSVLDASRRDWREAGGMGAVHASSSRAMPRGERSLNGTGAKTSASLMEAALFENPTAVSQNAADAWPMRLPVHGASYVRPPIEPITIEKAFAKMDDFTWRGREFGCVQTGGKSRVIWPICCETRQCHGSLSRAT